MYLYIATMSAFASIMILFIQGCAKTEGLIPTILVNNVVLSTSRGQLRRSNRSLIYYYEDGDLVDVSCICLKRKCDVCVDYGYATALDDAFHCNYSLYEAGFRFKFQAAHNNSQLTCKMCNSCQEDVTVTFILRSELHRVLNLKINGFTIRDMKPKPAKRITVLLRPDAYYEHQSLNVECETREIDAELELNTKENSLIDLRTTKSRIVLNTPIQPLNLIFTVYKNKKRRIIKQLELHIKFRYLDAIEHPQLIMDLPKDKILMEFHNYEGLRVIYYEYEDDHRLNFNCSTSSQKAPQGLITFKTPVATQISPGSIFSEMKLTAENDKNVLQCTLKSQKESNEISTQETWGQALILLHHKSTSEYSKVNFVYLGVGIAVTVLAGVCIFGYWRLRKKTKSSKEATNDTAKKETSRPVTASSFESLYHAYESIKYAYVGKSNRNSDRYVNTAQNRNSNLYVNTAQRRNLTIKTDITEPYYCDPSTITNTS